MVDVAGANRRLLFRPRFTAHVGSWQSILGAPQRGDYKNAAQFCKAEHAFFGEDAFKRRYGDKANAFGEMR